jgi:7-cyano-7-deazaguanine synthase
MKTIVLLSGGQDSTTCLFWAISTLALGKASDVVAVSARYGQRHSAELMAAQQIAQLAGVEHVVLDLPTLAQIGGSALVDASVPLTGDGGHVDEAMPQGLPTSFVPGRNAFFILAAAARGVRRGISTSVTGGCQTDYSGYPDCRRDFIDSMERMLTLAMPSSCGPFHVLTPLMRMTKAQTVDLAHQLGSQCWLAIAKSITCYNGKRPGCGACGACDLRAKGFDEARFLDPGEVLDLVEPGDVLA